MQGIIEILEKLENLIYKILIWIVLIPKTLLQVVLHPGWASTYINDELGEGKSRFDEYFSPVVLLLVVALLPFVIWNFLPVTGVELTSPSTENPSKDRKVNFEANIKFISTSTDGFISTFWLVEEENYDGSGYTYPVLKQNRYTNNPKEANSDEYFNYFQIDTHTIQDIYDYEFQGPGRYWVVVDASKFDSDGKLLETYESDIYIFVPESPDDNVTVNARTKSGGEQKPFVENLTGQLKNEKTIFLALGLLFPPLLFALAIKLFGSAPLSEDNLKVTFYVQCYYFAPIAFAFWATRYALQFFTPDVFFRYDTDLNLIVFLPMILVVFWFISVQTHVISKELKISGWLALLIVVVCMFILGAGILIVVFYNDPDMQDMMRKSSIWIYPLLAVGLLTTYHLLGIFKRRKESPTPSTSDQENLTALIADKEKLTASAKDKEKENLTVLAAEKEKDKDDSRASTADKVLAGGIIFIVFISLCLVLVAGPTPNVLTSKDFDVTQRSVALQSTAQFGTLEAQKYYTEEFNTNLDQWSDPIMASGDYSQVHVSTENGNLKFQLSELKDQIPVAYLINNAYKYTDVQVETEVTNLDENVNSVSLSCRFSDKGWYEFEVSNSGFYTIYAVDYQEYNRLAFGESTLINKGMSKNTYAAICKGNELTLIINGTPVAYVQDLKFNYTEGLVAISVSSPEGSPVEVDFGYVKMSAPTSMPDLSGVATVVVMPTEAVSVDTPLPSEATTSVPAEAITPIPEGQAFYTEEFDGSLDAWTPLTLGSESEVKRSVENGKLLFSLSAAGGNVPAAYLINTRFTYTDVQLDVVTTNNGNNSNAVTLVCRSTNHGWYEFNVSNSGMYSIYAVDADGIVKQGFNELASGNSAFIKVGLSTNLYTAVCKGNELSLSINGNLVDTVTDTSFNFSDGNIGIGVSSLQGLPVEVAIDTLTVSQP